MQGISGKIGLCAPPLHNWQNGMLQSVEECSEVAGDILESVLDNINFEIENIFLLGGFFTLTHLFAGREVCVEKNQEGDEKKYLLKWGLLCVFG